MNGLNYLLQTNLYLLLFMGFYVLVLRNETFFRQNRFFLNTSTFLSFLIPFINSDWFRELFITQKVRETAIMPSQMIYETIIVGISEEASTLSLSDAILLTYLAGVSLFLLRFLIRIAFLKSNLKAERGSAFSFFNTLVVDSELPKVDTIIGHEKVHMRQWHSADIIFIELASIINWFNPVMLLYKKEIRHIHEFIADEEAAGLMPGKADYALLLFSNTLGIDPLHLSNSFFNKSLLKRRILMLHKNRSHRTGLWKYGFSAPLFILMLIVSAAIAGSEHNALGIDNGRSITALENLKALELPDVSMDNLKTPKNLSTKPKDDQNSVSRSSATKEPGSFARSASDLKRHIATTIKYTAAAKADKATGYIVANFLVKNKAISDVEITKALRADLDKEVLNAFASFNRELDVPDNDYSIGIVYLPARPLTEEDGDSYKFPQSILFSDNFLGLIMGTVKEDGDMNMGWAGKMVINQQLQTKLPQFPGGSAALANYINKNLKYPELARKNNITGRVVLSFDVEVDGSIESIKVLRGIGGGADEEAVRLIAQSPKWNPGLKDGKPVRKSYTMPIAFALNGKPLPRNPSVNPNQGAGIRPSVSSDVYSFSEVEVLPEFPGGGDGWAKYISSNLKYPELAKKENITGRVIMSFVVEKDGSLSGIKVLRGIGGGADEEALRVLKSSPKWKPGLASGDPVKVAYTMPIFFPPK